MGQLLVAILGPQIIEFDLDDDLNVWAADINFDVLSRCLLWAIHRRWPTARLWAAIKAAERAMIAKGRIQA